MSIVKTLRGALYREVRGCNRNEAQECKRRVGLREGTFQRSRKPEAETGEEALQKYNRQVERGVAVPREGRPGEKVNIRGCEDGLGQMLRKVNRGGERCTQLDHQLEATPEELEEEEAAIRVEEEEVRRDRERKEDERRGRAQEEEEGRAERRRGEEEERRR